jgi:rubrerythrin
LEVEKRCCADLMEQMYLVEQFDPDLAAELRDLHEHEKRHLEEVRDMLMKSDPQAYWSA